MLADDQTHAALPTLPNLPMPDGHTGRLESALAGRHKVEIKTTANLQHPHILPLEGSR